MRDLAEVKNRFGYVDFFTHNGLNEQIVLRLDNIFYPKDNRTPITYNIGDSRKIALYLEYADHIEKGGTIDNWRGDKSVIEFDIELGKKS